MAVKQTDRWVEPLREPRGYGYKFLQFANYGNGLYVYHPGTDIAGYPWHRIRNVANGIVEWAGYSTGWGWHIFVRHFLPNGKVVLSHHAHMARIDVKQGQVVTVDQPLGIVGTTGNSTGIHDHFEIRVPGLGITFFPYTKYGWTRAKVASKYFRPLQFIIDQNRG